MPVKMGDDLRLELTLSAKNLMGKGTRDAEKDVKKFSRSAESSADKIAAAYKDLGIRSSKDISREMHKIQASYKRLQATGELSAKEQGRAYDQLQRKLKKLRNELRGVQKDTKAVGGAATGMGTRLPSMLAGAGVVAGAAVGVKGIIQAGVEMERIELTLRAVTGSSRAAGQEFEFVSHEADRLGLNLQRTAKDYAQLMAASKGTKLEGQATRDIFVAVSEASAVLGLSAADNEGILRSLNQMMSKGTVQAEELRGQLGDRLPGAFNIAAKAMGVSTAELGKMMEQGRVISEDFLPKFAAEIKKTYGDQVPAAMDSSRASFERMNTSIFNMKAALAKSGLMEAAGNIGEGAAAFFEDAVDGLLALTKTGAISAAHFVQSFGATAEEQKRLGKVFEESYRQIRTEYGMVAKDLEALGPGVKLLGDRLNNSLKRPAKSAKELRAELQKIGTGAAKAISPALKSLADLSKAMESQYSKNKSLREKVFNATGGAAAGHFKDQINAMKAEAKAMLGAQIAEADVTSYIEQQLAALQQSMQQAGAQVQVGYVAGMDAGSVVAQLSADIEQSTTAMDEFKKRTAAWSTELSKAATSYSKMLRPEVAQQFMAQIDRMRSSLVSTAEAADIEAQFDISDALTEVHRIQEELANIPRVVTGFVAFDTNQAVIDIKEIKDALDDLSEEFTVTVSKLPKPPPEPPPPPPGEGGLATGGTIPKNGLYYLHEGEKVQSNNTYGDFNFNFASGQMTPGEARAFVRNVVIPELNAAGR